MEQNDEQHDGDKTSPDLGVDDKTNPGAGPFASIAGSLGRAVAAVRTLAGLVPGLGEAGRRRSLEVLAHALGILGDLAHDTRRAILALVREEFDL